MKLSRLLSICVAATLTCGALFAGDKKDDAAQSAVSFLVVKDDSGKPVRNAAVILHPVGKHGKQSRGGFELKTDADGKTHFDAIPHGALRVQVIASGFQTYGEDFNIVQPSQEITVHLKRPQQQYSIYEKHESDSSSPK